MDYISAEEFQKQPVEVQNIFIDWWKPEIGERIYSTGISSGECIYLSNYKENGYEVLRLEIKSVALTDKNVFIPLFTETQLRKFIEEKTKYGLLIYTPDENMEASIQLFNDDGQIYKFYEDLGHDLLKAYWQVACKIAEEC